MSDERPGVGIIMGSKSDWPTLKAAAEVLDALRVPYETSKQKLNPVSDMPVVQLFNNAYEKSLLSPFFLKGAPYFLTTLKPMLPPQVQAKGAVPLLESIVAQQPAQ